MNKKIILIVFVALLVGAGVTGAIYVVTTPTSIAPRASAPVVIPTTIPVPTSVARPSPTRTPATPTPAPVTEQSIIDGFGTTNPTLDLNKDGLVNSIDLVEYRSRGVP